MPPFPARLFQAWITAVLLSVWAQTTVSAADLDCAVSVPLAFSPSRQMRFINNPSEPLAVEEVDGAILVVAKAGLLRLEDDGLRLLGDHTETGWVSSIHKIENAVLIGAEKGLFRLEGDRLRRLESDAATSWIMLVKQVESAILVGANNGLFRLEGDRLIQVGGGTDLGQVMTVIRIDGTILISAQKGLFRLEGDQLTLLWADTDTDTGWFELVKQIQGPVLLRSQKSLFRLEGDRLIPLGAGADTGRINLIEQVQGTILVGAENGLFRLEGDRLIPLGAGADTGWITRVEQVEGAVLIGANKGLFRLEGDRLTPLGAGADTGWITRVEQVEGAVLIGANKGLFRLKDGRLTPIAGSTDMGSVSLIEQVEGAVLIGTKNGLFRLKGDRIQKVVSDWLADVALFHQKIGTHLWLGGRAGLFRYVSEPRLASALTSTQTISFGMNAALRFAVSPCLTLIPPSQLGLIQDSQSLVPAEFGWAGKPMKRILSATISALPAGTWRVRLAVKAGDGWEPISDPVELRVDWTPTDYASHYLRQATPWLAGVHTGLFLLLLAGARRSPWCWRMLSDPLWGPAGLWWHFALRHVPALQRWVLAHWFDAARRRDWRPYLSVPLAAPNGEILATETLFDRLHTQPRLWVQGGPGMGKTTLVSDLARQFFAGHTSLRAAYRRYGFIPIIVRLRNVLDVKPDPAHPDRWLSELARKALRADGLRIDDPALFRAILESGSFALILDGANETTNAQALVDYASTTPEIRFLVTSQADPPEPSDPEKPGFELLRLPGTVEEMVGPLLSLFLGPERGTAVLKRVRSTPLWHELTSGYDVRLLADLAGRDGPVPELPADRIGLYRALLARLRYAGGAYPEAELSRAAWAMWRDGVRRFDSTKYLTPDLIEPLRQDDARVVRTIGGALHEFRHDQMRGYLAALWAVRHEVAPVRLFDTDKAIWRLGFSEQAVVWEFFAALIDQARGEAIWQWCHDDPERAVLLHALDQKGRKEGWRLVRNAPGTGYAYRSSVSRSALRGRSRDPFSDGQFR